jgi:hypothetical protein
MAFPLLMSHPFRRQRYDLRLQRDNRCRPLPGNAFQSLELCKQFVDVALAVADTDAPSRIIEEFGGLL